MLAWLAAAQCTGEAAGRAAEGKVLLPYPSLLVCSRGWAPCSSGLAFILP